MKEYTFVTHYFTGGLETRSEGHRELIQQKGLYADFVSARQEAIGWKLAQ